jgi:hypothetical protein
MKKILLFFTCFLVTQISLSQIVRDSITGKVTFIKVNEINLPDEELKLHANSWIIENFTNDGDRLQTNLKFTSKGVVPESTTITNTNEGIKLNTKKKIISKGVFREITIMTSSVKSTADCLITYFFEISFKKNRYRIKLHSFKISSETYPLFAKLVFERPTVSIEAYKNNLIKSAELEGKSSRKKKMIKVANNPKKIKNYFEYHQVRDEHVIKQIENKFNSLSKSLHSYLLDKVEEKW